MIKIARPITGLLLIAEAALFSPGQGNAAPQPGDATASQPPAPSLPPGQEIQAKNADGDTITCVTVPGMDATPNAPALPPARFRMRANKYGFLAISPGAFGTLERTGPSVMTAVIYKGVFQGEKAFLTFPSDATGPQQTAERDQIKSLNTFCEALEAQYTDPLPQPAPEANNDKARLHRETMKLLGTLHLKALTEKPDTKTWGPYNLSRTHADQARYQTLVTTNIGPVPNVILLPEPVAQQRSTRITHVPRSRPHGAHP